MCRTDRGGTRMGGRPCPRSRGAGPGRRDKNRIWREIERKLEKERREEARGKAVRRGIKGAMLAAVALSILLVGLFVTVSAFRVPVSNYFFEKYDKYSKFIVDAGGYTIGEKPESDNQPFVE